MTERACRSCSCTEWAACPTPSGSCYWVEADLCSACVNPRLEALRWAGLFLLLGVCIAGMCVGAAQLLGLAARAILP